MGVLPAFTSVPYIHAWFSCGSESSVGFLGTGVPDDCESPYGSWEQNPGLLEEKQVLLTADPSF